MKHKSLALLVVSLFTVYGANIPITIVGATETQIVISYTATTTGSCTLTATDQSVEHPTVIDLDTSKRGSNANIDINRTVANGFRWPSVCGGHYCSGATDDVHRTVIIGGHDEMIAYPVGCTPETGGATGCKYIGTALQVATPHNITVSCNAGADTGSIGTSTTNLNMGSYYPEYQIPVPGFGLNASGYLQPTVDVTNQTPTRPFYIDPLKGTGIKFATNYNSSYSGNSAGPYNFAVVIADANWTNPNNFNTRQVAGTLATTSTTGDKLFAAFPLGRQDSGFQTGISDLVVTPYGSSTNHTEIAEFCISLDSGQTCANYTPIDVTFSNAATGCQPTGNCSTSTLPSSTTFGNAYSTWGGLYQWGQEDVTNMTFGNVSVSNSTVTVTPSTTGGSPVKFPLWLKAGTKFDLTGCATGSITNTDANGHLTISSVQSYGQITTVEVGNTATGCTYKDYHAGVTVMLKNTGTLNVSLNLKNYQTNPGATSSDPERWYCNYSGQVTDIMTNCDGTTNTTPQTGYLCRLPAQYLYLVQTSGTANGQICKQSNFRDVPGGHTINSSATVNWLAPNQYMATANNGDVIIGTHKANDYTALPPGDLNEGTRVDNFTYTVFSGATSINTQLQAQGGLAANIANFLGGVGLSFVVDNGGGTPYLQYEAAGVQNSPCMLAFADATTNTLIGTINLLGDYPENYGGCHFGPQGSAGNTIVNNLGDGNPNFYDTTVKLGGPYKALVIGVYKNGSPNKKTLAISAATNASPAVLTSANNDLAAQGNTKSAFYITCSGATDPQWNGQWFFRRIDNNTFSLYHDDAAQLPLDSTAFGAIGAGYTCQVAAGVYAIPISTVVNNGGNARLTLNLADGGFVSRFPSGVFPGTDADPICLTNTTYCTSTAQYWIQKTCAGCTASQVDVFKDSGLTTHATFTEINTLAPSLMAYAETCPDQNSITLPGPLYTESGWGNSPTARVGCVSYEVLGHFCSSWPSAGEAATFPCPENSATTSMIHDFQVGDGVYEMRGGTSQETMYLLTHATDPHDTNAYKITMLRTYGNINGTAKAGNGMANHFAINHAFGFGVMATSVINQAIAINIASIGTATPPFGVAGSGACGCHCEAMVPSKDVGKITTAYAWSAGCNGGNPDYVNATLAQYATPPPTFPKQNISPAWQTGLGSVTPTNNSYPSHRQIFGPATEQDMLWKFDQFLNVQPTGNGPNAEDDNIGLSRTLVNVSGNIWRLPVAGTISGGSVNIKTTPILVHDLPWWYFKDKSGPGSVLSDPADMGFSCTAYRVNECVAGSTVGQVFAVFNKTYDPGNCMANSTTNGGLCSEPFYAPAGWFSQFVQVPPSANNEGVRPLTKLFWEPPGHYEFYSATPTIDGHWDMTSPMPWNANNRICCTQVNTMVNNLWVFIKNPPWQNWDSSHRQRYFNYPVQYGGGAGVTVRTTWGYGENGDPNNGYCITYQEQCFTTTAATTANPFVFASETQNLLTCTSGCTDNVPLIPGRVAYIKRLQTVSAVETAGPIEVVAIP